MPQLVKGAKWCFGWVVVTPMLRLTIPPEAWDEYRFQPGDDALFFPGSRTSGGYGLSTPHLVSEFSNNLTGEFSDRSIARGRFGNGVVQLPPELSLKPGERLLAVRGSGLALGLLTKGLIFAEACKHPDLEIFDESTLPEDEDSR